MADERLPAVERLPTLTEVIDLQPVAPGTTATPDEVGDLIDAAASPEIEAQVEPVPSPTASPSGTTAVDLDALVACVLQDIGPRIDMLLQTRLREALAPALAQAAEHFIREAREPVAVVVRELVQDSVVRALQRREKD